MFRGLPQLILAGLRSTVRSRAAMFWTLAFPSFFVLLFGYVFGRGESANVNYLMPGLWTITIISSTFFGASMQMVQERENGTFRRYRVTPLHPVALVASFGIVTTCVLGISLIIQGLLAWILFRIDPAGSLAELVIVFLIGLLGFVPLGLLVGSIAKDMKSAPVITNLLFFPMMFLSGAAFPFAFLPDFVQKIARFLPSTYLMEALQGVVVRGESLTQLLAPIAVLLVTCVLGLALNGLLFRWESEQPINRRNLFIALAGLIGLYTVVALAGPTLRMTTMPGDDGNESGQGGGTSGEAGSAHGGAGAGANGHGLIVPELADLEGPIIVLEGMTVLDGMGGRVPNARVVLRGGFVTSVESMDDSLDTEFQLPGSIDSETPVSVHRWDGLFATPGLLDARVHLSASGGGQASMAEWTGSRQIRDLQAYLGVGVTGIVSTTDNLEEMLALRDAVERGTMRAPRVIVAGPTVTATGGVPANRFAFAPNLAERLTRQVDTAAEARDAVNALAETGADAVHLMRWREPSMAGGSATPVLSTEAMRAAIDAALAKQLSVAVQTQTGEDVQEAISSTEFSAQRRQQTGQQTGQTNGQTNGQQSGQPKGQQTTPPIATLRIDGVPAPLASTTIETLREHQISLVPALVSFERLWKAAHAVELDDPLITRWNSREIVMSLRHPASWLTKARSSRAFVTGVDTAWRSAQDAVEQAIAAGLPILVGSSGGDPGVLHGSSYVRELELLHEAGASPGDLLVSATSRVAEWAQRPDLGRLVPGARADLVIFGLDPSGTVTAYRTLRAVYFRGDRLILDGLLNTSAGNWQPK